MRDIFASKDLRDQSQQTMYQVLSVQQEDSVHKERLKHRNAQLVILMLLKVVKLQQIAFYVSLDTTV